MRFLFQDESVDDVTSVAGYGNLNVWFGFLLLFGVGGVLYPFCTCCAAACMSEDSSAGAASAANPALAGLTSRSRCRRAYAVFGIIIAFVFRLLALIAGSIWFEEDGQLSAKQAKAISEMIWAAFGGEIFVYVMTILDILGNDDFDGGTKAVACCCGPFGPAVFCVVCAYTASYAGSLV